MARAIHLHGRPLAEGRLPAVCTPLVARTRDALVAEAAQVAALAPDLIEWRVDFFERIGVTADVLEVARQLRDAAQGIPILFTRRSTREGGEPIPLDETQVLRLTLEVIASGTIDAVDYEMAAEAALVAQVREAARAHDVTLVLSCHDFHATPPDATLDEHFARARLLGADVAKIAVMPKTRNDVLRLLAATCRASESLKIPVVSMAMGPLGVPTRLVGGEFGSALTFARGAGASAPGQVPVDDVRAVLTALRRATTAG